MFGLHISTLLPIIKAFIILIAGYIVAKLLAKSTEKYLSKHATAQQAMILKKITFFTILVLFIVASLQQMDFELTVLLGSAGIITAAIGFASKSSISNIISGLFLIVENTFEVGDTISVKGKTGKVVSIDLLSVKLKTPDNTLIRIPNESIISSELTNSTRFPTRRLDIKVSISYDEDIERASSQLLTIANDDPDTHKMPEPFVVVTDLADSAVIIRLSLWMNKAKYTDAKCRLLAVIKTEFDKVGINIPYPQLVVHQSKTA